MKLTQRLPQVVALALLLSLGLSLFATAQEQRIQRKDVPAAVLSKFEQTYPKATIKGYSKEMDKGQIAYEIQCVEGETMRDVTYSADGELISVEESVHTSQLPPAVKAALDKRFPGAKILRSEKVTKATVTGYEFTIEHKGKKTEIVFDAEGNELTM